MKVKCTDKHHHSLTYGEIYNAIENGEHYTIDVDDNGLRNADYFKYRFEVVQENTVYENPEQEQKMNKYNREIRPNVYCDVYDVIRAFNVTDPCLQHAIKKLLAAGERGHKDRLEDLEDILASVNRAIEMHKEWNKVDIDFSPIKV